MNSEKYSSDLIAKLLKTNKVCTLNELMRCLGTEARRTVFRKLSEIEYQTSYSHHGKYYALKSCCKFDDAGLWRFDGARFSVYGTLLETARKFVERSNAGRSVEDLSRLLDVSTKQALLSLQNRELLIRQKFEGKFIYFSSDEGLRRKQILARGSGQDIRNEVNQELLAHEVKAAIILFFSLLNEKQRRLFAGMEAIRTSNGGDAKISEFLGIDPHTVAKGRRELLSHDINLERLRQPGAGRKKHEKKVPK